MYDIWQTLHNFLHVYISFDFLHDARESKKKTSPCALTTFH